MTEQQYDVVVVGSGGGALTGAVLAAKAGLSVCVVEKTSLLGGTSAYSGGACWLPGSEVQQRAGIPDSTEGARDYLAAILEDVDQAKVEAFLAHAPELVAELEADPDLDFEWLPFSEYYDAPGRVPFGRSIQPTNVKRADLPPEVAELVRPPVERDRAGEGGRNTLSGGQSLIARLAAIFVREGGDDPHQPAGHRAGHRRQRPGGRRRRDVTARGRSRSAPRAACCSAAGGFEGNAEMRREHDVPGDVAWTMAPRGDQHRRADQRGDRARRGDRLPRARLVLPRPGAARRRRLVHARLPQRADGRPDRTPLRQRVPALRPVRPGDGQGARADPVVVRLRRPRGRPAARDRDARGRPGRAPRGRHLGHAPTRIEELAAATGLPADVLAATVERFNGFAETGVDEDFGRGEDEYDTFFAGGTGPNKALTPCDQPPYYAARFVLSDLGTKGGLVTDAAGRVLREDGSAIAGPLRVAATPRRRCSARSTPARAPRSARRWCSPRWRCGTSLGT